MRQPALHFCTHSSLTVWLACCCCCLLPSLPLPLPLLQIFRGLVCDVSVNTVTLEVTGKQDKMLALKEVLEPYGEGRGQGRGGAAGRGAQGRGCSWG